MPKVAVAYSGGRDSTALLHATLNAARGQGVVVLALHVNHGLSAHADAWEHHASEQCDRWARRGFAIEFVSRRLTTRPTRGESVEAWARQARYGALRQMALDRGSSLVLLAQHRRDQAETFVLQALRGAGVSGLAGMPRVIERDGITWMRPWLDMSREQIDAYVRRHRLRHVDDDSNANHRFARNRLRHAVWPALTDAFPQAEAALADSAVWAQEAAECLAELAQLDLAAVASSTGLDIKAWSTLSQPRRSNVLRAWLRRAIGHAAPASLTRRLLVELPARSTAEWQCESGSLKRHRGVLKLVRGEAAKAVAEASRELTLSVRRAGTHALPGWGGRLQVKRVKEGGVPIAWLAHLDLKPRTGGERFQAGIGRPPRSLKKQFQSAALPAWERDGPLIYSGGQLVFVPGLGIDARVIALPGQAQATLQWLPSGER